MGLSCLNFQLKLITIPIEDSRRLAHDAITAVHAVSLLRKCDVDN